MQSSMHAMAIDSFVPMLRSLSQWLDKGNGRAGGDTLAHARLAPDMYTLTKQVQLACDHATDATAHLTGQAPPGFEHREHGLDGLKAGIARTIVHLQGVQAAAFDGAEDRTITLDLQNDLVLTMTGFQFLRDWALPHFYFHVVTAYDILRHHGVEIGKQDYLGQVAYAIRRRGGREERAVS